MTQNIADKVSSDYTFQIVFSDSHETNQVPQDNDSDSSIFNLLDRDFSDKSPEESASPYHFISETMNFDNVSQNFKIALPDIKCETTDQVFENNVLSKLPQIIVVEKTSLQYEVLDNNYPCLSKSFQTSFNSPVLDILVVVLNSEKLVTFYQGYFSGIPKLANELINLNRKYWKSLISNNDENAWENHYKSVSDKFKTSETSDAEFEVGPVIRCRLKASHNQKFNFFFVQPCSYMIKLNNSTCRSFQHFNEEELNTGNVYMVSYMNIMRECDAECALKGSAVASLQKVINNSIIPIHSKTESFNNQHRRVLDNSQLSVTISPAYINFEKQSILAAPITYPIINESQYPKVRSQMQPHFSQHKQPILMNNNQYMNHGLSINIINSNEHPYQSSFQNQQSTSTLQYILESRNPNFSCNKQIHNDPIHMVPQHNSTYQNMGRPNLPCYLPLDHLQSTPSSRSLSSSSSYLQSRHFVPMSSNNILLSNDQYFRNGKQINLIDSVQVAQPLMTVVRSLSSNLNNCSNTNYCNASQKQLSHTSVNIANSISHQSKFSKVLPSYCNNKNEIIQQTNQSYNVNHMVGPTVIKQESYENIMSQKDWHSNHIIDDTISTQYCGSLNSMTNNSMSFDIVEEILKAEEAKSDNKQKITSQSSSDSSDQLSFEIDDFALLENGGNHQLSYEPASIQNNVNAPKHSVNDTKLSTTCLSLSVSNVKPPVIEKYNKVHVNPSDSLSILKTETKEKFTNSQKIGIKNLINQHKDGKISKKQMLHQIDEFVRRTLGKDNYQRRILEFWKTQNPSVDSTLCNLNCSHEVQSPEEGPGISPTEQAAQSTTDMEDDKEVQRHVAKKAKEDNLSELSRRYCKSKSVTKSIDASIYSITSTTSTGVLETLLNEHDKPVHPERNNLNNKFNAKLSVTSISKNQLSLDQLLMNDDCPMLSGFNQSHNENVSRKSSDTQLRPLHDSNKSQPSTPVSGNMGVLESLLNQKNPSVYRIRQKSTETILKHSNPSRQNSMDTLHESNVGEFSEKDIGMKKNSLLITLLNNPTGTASIDKYNTMNISNTSSIDTTNSAQPKRQRMLSGASVSLNENSNFLKKQVDKFDANEMDVFDFIDSEFNSNNTEFQSGKVTSSQTFTQNMQIRKRYHSKEILVDSDTYNDKITLKSASNDKKFILTSLLDGRKGEDTIVSSVSSEMQSAPNNADDNFNNETNETIVSYEDNLDLEDIKIDDFDLEHLIDVSEQSDGNDNEMHTSYSCPQISQKSVTFGDDDFNVISNENHNAPLYTEVPPVISISQSDPIVPVSKQSIIRVSDRNSILFSAIQSSSVMSSISTECLDNERERLLKQQQKQKMCMSGKYVSLNQLGSSDANYLLTNINHTLSLDLLSKQMKEVGPNVMVEPSNNVDNTRSGNGTFSRMPPVISSQTAMLPSSPIERSSSSSTSTCTDIQVENVKISSTTPTNVNHQQVREGLRLLVSNRSAQNNSKSSQRSSISNVSESVSHSTDSNVTRTSMSKGMIHYHSDTQVPTQPLPNMLVVSHPPPSVPESKDTNVLEDSLVDDVFGLEELVNSKVSNTTVDNMNYQISSVLQPSPSSLTGGTQGISSDIESSQIVAIQTNVKQPHHHHHLPHYHHHHHHHHANTQQNTDHNPSLTNEIKPTVNSSTSGLLETLLSR